MSLLPAGGLDRRIVIQSATETRDEFGAPVMTWATFAEVWAQKLQQTGREFLAADTVTAERRTVWRIHWRSGITETMRVLYEAQLYLINEVREIGRREGLELHTTALVDL